jgi:parallel beta-helix repeat protein
MGGPNEDQLIEYVRSYDPRSWTCLHIFEGPGLLCNSVVVQNNELGPCGTPGVKEDADAVSISCRSTIVRNNMINNPTQGGISLISCPGTLVENNTIWVVNVRH